MTRAVTFTDWPSPFAGSQVPGPAGKGTPIVAGFHNSLLIAGPARSGGGVGRGVGLGVGRGLGVAQTAPTGQGVMPGDGPELAVGDWHGTPIGHGVADGSPGLWTGQPLAKAKPGGQSGVGETVTAGDEQDVT